MTLDKNKEKIKYPKKLPGHHYIIKCLYITIKPVYQYHIRFTKEPGQFKIYFMLQNEIVEKQADSVSLLEHS